MDSIDPAALFLSATATSPRILVEKLIAGFRSSAVSAVRVADLSF